MKRCKHERSGPFRVIHNGQSLDEWREVPDDQHITIHNFDGHDNVASKPAGGWIERDGRGFLCSTEY